MHGYAVAHEDMLEDSYEDLALSLHLGSRDGSQLARLAQQVLFTLDHLPSLAQ